MYRHVRIGLASTILIGTTHIFCALIFLYRIRRVFFIGVIPLMAQKDISMFFLGMIFALISSIAYNEMAPYEASSNNLIAKVAQYVILVTYGSGVALETDTGHVMNPIFFGCLILASNLFLILVAGSLVWKRFKLNPLKWAALPDGMEYHFFLCSYQPNSREQCDILATELQRRHFKVWHRDEVDELTEAEIIAAVERSHIFLLFLNKHTLSSWPVQLRVNAAIERAKYMILICEKDSCHRAPLNGHGHLDLDKCFEYDPEAASQFCPDPDGEKSSEGVNEEPLRKNIRGIFQDEKQLLSRAIPYMRSPFHEVMLDEIIKQAQALHQTGDIAVKRKSSLEYRSSSLSFSGSAASIDDIRMTAVADTIVEDHRHSKREKVIENGILLAADGRKELRTPLLQTDLERDI